MNAETLSGLWYIHEPFANRMGDIIIPRLAAGMEPFPAYLRPNAGIDVYDKNGDWSYVRASLDQYLKAGGGEVAVIPIVGTMSRFGMCGMGNEFIAAVLQEAAFEPKCKAVVLKATSPGGTVDSTEMLADQVRLFPKPVVAFVAGQAASACLFVISQADVIVIENSVSAEMGSIGVLAIHVDQSQALEKQGMKVTIFRATDSVDKMRINPVEPLNEGIIQELQENLDASQKTFKGYVRRGRAGKLKSDEVFTGKMYNNPNSIRLGLADRSGSLQDAIKIAKAA